jgi:CheY-like chemotaxis protein
MHDGLEFRTLRVLVVGGKPHAVRTLRTVFSLLGLHQIVVVPESEAALQQLRFNTFDAVFCDEIAEKVGGLSFAVAARRDPEALDKMVPIFLTCAGARRRQVEAARDEGVTDVLARPISAATIGRKFALAVNKPRSFIVAPTFFGPDRRSKGRSAFNGPDRRIRAARKVKIAKPAHTPDGDMTPV